jgi:hypothetical protein
MLLTFEVFHACRLMLGRTPWGAYKLSRRSLLVADLPKVYTCRAHWQGASPKSLLADFCQQHRLPEAQYTYNDSQDSGNANMYPLEEEGNSRDLVLAQSIIIQELVGRARFNVGFKWALQVKKLG